MKKIILILSAQFIFCGLILSDSGWLLQTSGTTVRLNSVYFHGPSTGWAVGMNIILKTTDGGQSWISQEFPFGENDYYIFNSVCFTNAQTGWIVGEVFKNPPGLTYRIIFRTSNGGISWNLHYLGGDVGLNSICFRDSECGWTVGPNSILSTTDEGINWIEHEFPVGENDFFEFNSTRFVNSETGWVAGTLYKNPPGIIYKTIFRTTNGGSEWTPTYIIDDTGLNSINFINVTKGWTVGGGSILATTNSGSNWTVQATYGSENCTYQFRSVFFINPMNGWVAGGSECTPGSGYSRIILRTSNGGNSWTEQTFPVIGNNYLLTSVFFINENTGWAVGDGGIIMKTINGGLTGIEADNTIIPGYKLYQNYPNPFNPKTHLRFETIRSGSVSLIVYNSLGQEINTLVKESTGSGLNTGVYEVEFDGSDYPSGIYFYSLFSGSKLIQTRKMILIK